MAEIKKRPHLDRIVKIKNGLIRGTAGSCPIYTVYKGIPYAKPPVGELRWKAPQPVEDWEGIRDCIEFAPIAPQEVHPYDNFWAQELWYHQETQNEDCLYLNVWTPSITGDEKLPVLFWTHGGALVSGYSHEPEFDGEVFCREGVILVTYNYRLGILGFYGNSELAAENNGLTGNYGHLDQVAALKWVRENIAAFGGDPDRITVFGQSAGAHSTQTLCTTPLTKGDIYGAIVVSSAGAAKPGVNGELMRGGSIADLVKMGDAYLEASGCKNTEELRKLSYAELVEVPGFKGDYPNGIFPKFRFSTVVDNYLLSKTAGEAAYAGEMHDIHYMVGNTAGEGGGFGFGKPAATVEEWRKQTAAQLGEDFVAAFPVETVEEGNALMQQNHGMMLNNRAFCEVMLRNGKEPAYLYLFDRDLPGDNSGSFHSGELFYVFGTLMRNWRPFTGVDFDISRTMTKTWANFAKNGNPNGEGIEGWKPYTADNRCNYRYCEDSKCEPIVETPVQAWLLKQKLD